jgi:phosphatidylglycerophosphate synthase
VNAFWLTAFTGSRLFVCVPVWLWCWWRRPRGMVVWMTLAALAFVATDFTDGRIARAHGLDTRAGFWLDHLADLFGILAMAATIVLGPREERARGARGRAPRRPPAPPRAP